MAQRTHYADDRNGFLYLAKCGSIYKIGFTSFPKARASSLRRLDAGCNYEFVRNQVRLGYLPEMIHTFPVSQVRLAERAMHKRFNREQLHYEDNWREVDRRGGGRRNHLTEWFRLSSEDVAWFCSIATEDQLQ